MRSIYRDVVTAFAVQRRGIGGDEGGSHAGHRSRRSRPGKPDHRNRFAAVGIILAIGLMTVPATAAAPLDYTAAQPPSSSQTSTAGIDQVGPDPIQFRAQNEDQAMAFDAALTLALENSAHMGYPWVDYETETLRLTTVDDEGVDAARSGSASLDTAGLTIEIAPTQASIAALDELADDATRLSEAGIPNGGLVWKTEPDQKNNRVIITISEWDDELADALSARYGDLVAVRVTGHGSAETASRDSDSPAFWGGAYISTSTGKGCTTGFSWTVGTVSAMLTAAHCISTGGTISYPLYSNAGTVASGSEENWNDTYGTRYYTGQSTYRGDVALIRYSGYNSSPRVYSGAAHTSTNTGVWAMASRRAQVGDSACVSGVTTGLWCGVVFATNLNVNYFGDGANVWARHMVEDDSQGWTCPSHGDSGAPVYRIRDDGNVVAMGIFSGYLPIGIACSTWFTDIYDSYVALPGVLKHL